MLNGVFLIGAVGCPLAAVLSSPIVAPTLVGITIALIASFVLLSAAILAVRASNEKRLR